jgi:hypothetical protein
MRDMVLQSGTGSEFDQNSRQVGSQIERTVFGVTDDI